MFVAGSYAYGSVNLSSSSTDSATVWQDGTATTGGTAYANGCSSNAASAIGSLPYGAPGTATSNGASSSVTASSSTFQQSAVKTYTQNGLTSSTTRQQGVFAGGSYAFASLVYQYQAASASTYAEADAGSFTGASADSSSGASGAATTATQSVIAAPFLGMAGYSYTSSSSSQNTSSLSAHDGATQSSRDATAVRDDKTSFYGVYEAGSSGPGGTSLSSVVVNLSLPKMPSWQPSMPFGIDTRRPCVHIWDWYTT